MYGKLNELAEEYEPQMVEFCQRLMRVPALPGDEKGVADLYLAEMEKLGYDEVFRDAWGNVIGIIKGNIPGPTIMYNGHLDHVETGDYSEWDGYDPYGAEIDINKMFDQDMTKEEETEVIHGRAAADVKGGGATQVYAGAILIALKKQGYKLKGKYMLTMVVLEEPAEMIGMIKLLEETLPENGLKADACVSCEPSSLKLYLGHRGRVEIQVEVQGITSHGSAPWLGINAVNTATKFIDRVEEVVEAEKHVDMQLGKSSIALTIINCTPGSMCIVPDRCHITYDRRFPPTESSESCIAQIQRIIDDITAEDPSFRATVKIGAVTRTSYTGKSILMENKKAAWKLDREHSVTKACAAALKEVGQEVKYGYWDAGTDLSATHAIHGIPSIGYSPMQEFYCHRPIDKVRIDYMVKGLVGNVAIFMQLSELDSEDFKL